MNFCNNLMRITKVFLIFAVNKGKRKVNERLIMHIGNKKIGFNLFKDVLDISGIQTDSINNSIFVNSKDNKAESKQEKDEKNEYLNARILEVKEYTINEYKKEFKNQDFKYGDIMDESTFYKALDEYLDENLNSMVCNAA